MDELLHFARASGLDWDAEACARLLGKMGTDESISRDDFRNFFKTVGLHGAPEAVAAFIAVGSGVKSRLSRQCSGEVVPGSPNKYARRLAPEELSPCIHRAAGRAGESEAPRWERGRRVRGSAVHF